MTTNATQVNAMKPNFNQNKFYTIAEKKRYYLNKEFKRDVCHEPKPIKQISTDENKTLNQEKHLLRAYVENEYKTNIQPNNQINKIPIVSNSVKDINIHALYKHPTNIYDTISVRSILKSIVSKCFGLSNDEFDRVYNYEEVLLTIKYPIENVGGRYSMIFNNQVIMNENYYQVEVTDPILYAFVQDYSRNYCVVPGSTDLYILGSDLLKEVGNVIREDFERYFITLAKTIFCTSLIGQSINNIGIMEYPGFTFSFGTFSIQKANIPHNLHLVVNPPNMVYCSPLWGNVLHASFSIELQHESIFFEYESNTFFDYYNLQEIMSVFNHVSRTNITPLSVSIPVRLLPNSTNVTLQDHYNSNLHVRNTISSKLDTVKRYSYTKDKMFPKTKEGAVYKLKNILKYYDIVPEGHILDLGAAPGTMTQYFINDCKFTRVDCVTRCHDQDLCMYPNIAELIKNTEGAYFHATDAIDYLAKTTEKYDFIVSDTATAARSFLTQAVDHDLLYTTILHNITKVLRPNGTFIMKCYDFTPSLRTAILRLSKLFSFVDAIKPQGSCPTNAESYLIFRGFDQNGDYTHDLEMKYLSILFLQISNLSYLITKGFNIPLNYSLSHPSLRLQLSNLSIFPRELAPLMSLLSFSEYLYPANLEGILNTEQSHLHDQFLRIKWNQPLYPMADYRYIEETSIGYATKDKYLENVVIMHSGFSIVNNQKVSFLIVEKDIAHLLSPNYNRVMITNGFIPNCEEEQILFYDIMNHPTFIQLFNRPNNYTEFLNSIRYISLRDIVKIQKQIHHIDNTTIINQFFREASTLNLRYTKNLSSTTVSSNNEREHEICFDLSIFSNHAPFYYAFTEAKMSSKNLRTAFQTLFNKYSIKIPHAFFFETGLTFTTFQHIERSTNQICVSQPACVQLRRQNNFISNKKFPRNSR